MIFFLIRFMVRIFWFNFKVQIFVSDPKSKVTPYYPLTLHCLNYIFRRFSIPPYFKIEILATRDEFVTQGHKGLNKHFPFLNILLLHILQSSSVEGSMSHQQSVRVLNTLDDNLIGNCVHGRTR